MERINNCPDRRNENGKWVMSYYINGVGYRTRACVVWENMSKRVENPYHKVY